MKRQSKSQRYQLRREFNADTTGRGVPPERPTISVGAKARLNELIAVDGPENPWSDPNERARNHILISLISQSGLRSTEILSLKISDFEFNQPAVSAILIERRRSHSSATTKHRRLPLTDQLAKLTRDYISGARHAIHGAAKHDFVFVKSRDGSPLSGRALSQIFETLRKRFPESLSGLTPIALRKRCYQDWLEGSVVDPKLVRLSSAR